MLETKPEINIDFILENATLAEKSNLLAGWCSLFLLKLG